MCFRFITWWKLAGKVRSLFGCGVKGVGSLTRRSRKEVLLDILELVNRKPAKKTEIMYQCNLSWTTVNDALNELAERGFIAKSNPQPRQYEITDEGKSVLKVYTRLEKSFSS